MRATFATFLIHTVDN